MRQSVGLERAREHHLELDRRISRLYQLQKNLSTITVFDACISGQAAINVESGKNHGQLIYILMILVKVCPVYKQTNFQHCIFEFPIV